MLRRRDARGRNDDPLWSTDPGTRLDAARLVDSKAARRLAVTGWPPLSPAARNAWLLLVTTKPPQWRDPLLEFPEGPLTLGEPHPGFLYPDPIGFWTEVRRWCAKLAHTLPPTDAVAVSALVHLGDAPQRLQQATDTLRPHVVLFLDEAAWTAAADDLELDRTEAHHVPDPHRPGQVYQGLWGRTAEGRIIGKSPQHPAMHRLYDASEMDRFLAACPLD